MGTVAGHQVAEQMVMGQWLRDVCSWPSVPLCFSSHSVFEKETDCERQQIPCSELVRCETALWVEVLKCEQE